MKLLPGSEPRPKKTELMWKENINLLIGSLESKCPPEEPWSAAVGHSQGPLQPFLLAKTLDWCWAELGRARGIAQGRERAGAAHSRAVHSCAPGTPPLLFVFHPFLSPWGSIYRAGITRELLFSWYSHHAWAVRRAVFLLFQSSKWLTETSVKEKGEGDVCSPTLCLIRSFCLRSSCT